MSKGLRTYGPVQVRDLSKHWGQAKLTIGIGFGQATAAISIGSRTSMSAARGALFPYTEMPLSQYPNWQSLSPPREFNCLSLIKEVSLVWGKRKPSMSRIGALLKSVRGSIPSSAIRSMTCTPIYKQSESSGQTQPLNKSIVENLT
jgi:hypothetical protein